MDDPGADTTTISSMGTEDPGTVRFINEIDDIVPQYLRGKLAWSFMSRMVGVGKFEPNTAKGAIHWMEAHAIWMKMGIPARQVTNKFIMDIDNMRFQFRVQVRRATVPQNERQMIVKQVRETHAHSDRPAARGGFFNRFGR